MQQVLLARELEMISGNTVTLRTEGVHLLDVGWEQHHDPRLAHPDDPGVVASLQRARLTPEQREASRQEIEAARARFLGKGERL
jgi:hypothetical protein